MRHDPIQINLRNLWNGIYTTLNALKVQGVDNEQLCIKLTELPISERYGFIYQNWGQIAANRCQPALDRIAIIETENK